MKKLLTPAKGENHTADAVVIGGGMVGVATAYMLDKSGLKTILVEMRDGLITLTSSASIESFRLQFTEPAMYRLMKESMEFFEDMPVRFNEPEFDASIHYNGYLFITDDESTLPALKAAHGKYLELGLSDAEFLSGEETLARFPYLSPTVKGATFRQRDGWLSFNEVVQAMVRGGNARYFLNTKVLEIKKDAQGAVTGVLTDRGELIAPVVVNAAGPFAGPVGKLAGVELPLEPVRRQKAFIATGAAPEEAPLVMDIVNNCYWRPEAGGALMGWVDPKEPVSEPSTNPVGDWDFAAIVLDQVAKTTPFWLEVAENLRRNDINISAGQYVYTPDDQPLIGPTAEVPGFYVNCGYWAGMMLSPGAGKWIADIVTGRMDVSDDPLRPSRFAEGIVSKGGAFLRGRE